MSASISRRSFMQAAGAAVALSACATNRRQPESARTPGSAVPPNLLFVFPDEFRRQAVGCMGCDPVITPNLDAFAREGLLLTNAVSNRPVCSPYRASLLTGRYPFSTGVTTNCWNGTVPYDVYLRESERCISDVLHDAGYSCGYIGKWHLEAPQEPYLFPRGQGGAWDEYTPPGPRRHGFDFWHSYGCHDNHLEPHYWSGNAAREDYATVREWSPRHEAETAIGFLRNRGGQQRREGQPFALFVSMNPPHMPFDKVPPEYVERYGAKTPTDLLTRPNVNLDTEEAQMARRWAKHYFAAVTGVDEQFGRILQCLKEEGLEDNTLVVFTSDHGEMMGSQGCMYKTLWYEESLGVPFLLRWPGHLRPGREETLFSVPDIMPTLLGLMGLDARTPQQVEGLNQAGLFLGKTTRRPASALYLNHDPAMPELGARGVRTPRYTYVINRQRKGEERFLFDNQADPYQMRNRIGADTALEKELLGELNGWLDRTGDPWSRPAA